MGTAGADLSETWRLGFALQQLQSRDGDDKVPASVT